MFNIPVGDVFERLIDQLEKYCGGIFDVIKAVIEFVVSILENILRLEPGLWYVSLALAGLIFFLVALSLKRKWPGRSELKKILAIAGCIGVLAGGIDVWRGFKETEKLTLSRAEEMAAELEHAKGQIKEAVPEEYDYALASAERIVQSLPQSPQENGEAFEDIKEVVEELRSLPEGKYEDAGELLEKILKNVEENNIDVAKGDLEKTRKAAELSRGLTVISDLDTRIQSLENKNDAERKKDVIPAYKHEEMQEELRLLAGLKNDFSQIQADKLRKGVEEAAGILSILNPTFLDWYGWTVMILLFCWASILLSGSGLAGFTLVGFLLIVSMGYWTETMQTLALILCASFFALLIGIPLGIWAARNDIVDKVIRPILDFMQTMPPFVYLIPAVVFFQLGAVPGVIATWIFSTPPAVRFTNLGIRQVPGEVVEAGLAFGATDWHLLSKVQLPIALRTILSGVNQTIMLALSMVVIAGLIGAPGLGEVVVEAVSQLKIDVGFEGGISIVILAIFLDRIMQGVGSSSVANQ